MITKWTRKKFCLNVGCRQDYSSCDFKIKYKIFFIEKFNAFKYCIYIKGGHDNYLIGEGLKNAKSVFAKSIVNYLVKEGYKNRDIGIKLYDLTEPFLNPITKVILLFEKKKVNQIRYYKKKIQNGIYENCFQKGFEFLIKNY